MPFLTPRNFISVVFDRLTRSLEALVQGFRQTSFEEFQLVQIACTPCKSLANGMVVLAFVINVRVEKFKMRSMCFSFASVLKCASCA